MTSKRPRALGITKPEIIDDFKLIPGIGPAIERRLHSAGIRTYAQLAAHSPMALITSVQGLSMKKVTEQKWINQARKLAKQKRSNSGGPRAEIANRQRYATFAVELLLDDKNRVRRTHVTHIQNGDEDTWVNWQEARLLDFVVDQAGLQVQPLTAPSPITGEPTIRREITQLDMTEEASKKQNTMLAPAALHAELPIEVGKLHLVEFLVEREKDSLFSKGLRSQIAFQLSSNKIGSIAAKPGRCFVQLLACNVVTGLFTMLGAAEQTLFPNQLVYSIHIDFSVPKLGRYKLVVMILLPDQDIVEVSLGPRLKVIL